MTCYAPFKFWKLGQGFTLTELLISLLILGEIATFSIPKILTAQQNGSNNAKAKEVAATLTSALQYGQLTNQVTTNTYSKDLFPFMNYISQDTASLIDDAPNGSGSVTCSAAQLCIKLHNGGILLGSVNYFNGSTSLNYVSFILDPDGVYTGREDSIKFLLYYNQRVVSRNDALAGSTSSSGVFGPVTNRDPAWFSW